MALSKVRTQSLAEQFRPQKILCTPDLVLPRCQIRYRYDLYGNRHLGAGRLLSFSVPLEEEQSVLQSEHSITPTKIVPLLRRSTKTVIRWDSDKRQYTAQRPFLPVTQRITVSRTFGSNLQKARWWKGVNPQHTPASWARRLFLIVRDFLHLYTFGWVNEMRVFAPLPEGFFLVGRVDSVRLNKSRKVMVLTESKTNADLETAALQVSLYHYALEKLISRDKIFPWEDLWRCCNLDPDLALTDATLHWIAERTRERPELSALCRAKTLKDLTSILGETIRELVPADITIQQWIATPANRTPAAIFNRARNTQFRHVQYDSHKADFSIRTALDFWQARRCPSGPLTNRARVCGGCEYRNSCHASSRAMTNPLFLDSQSRNVEGNKINEET